MKKIEEVQWCPDHGYPLPCDKCGMPKPDEGRLLTREELALIEETKHYLNNLAPNDDGYLRILIERMVKRWEATQKGGEG